MTKACGVLAGLASVILVCAAVWLGGLNPFAKELDGMNEEVKKYQNELSKRLPGHLMRQQRLRQGLQYSLSQEEFSLAGRYAEVILKSDPDDADANFAMGKAYMLEAQYTQAETHLKCSLKHRAKEPAIWNDLAVVQLRQGHYDDAWQSARKALELKPDSVEFKNTLRDIKDEAREEFRKKLREEYSKRGLSTRCFDSLDNPRTLQQELQFCLAEAEFPLARSFAEKILKADPDHPDANFAMGMAYTLEDQYTRAETYLKRSLKRRAKEPAIWNNLAVVQFRQGHYDDARQSALKALELMPDSVEIKNTLRDIDKAIAEQAEKEAAAKKEGAPATENATPSGTPEKKSEGGSPKSE